MTWDSASFLQVVPVFGGMRVGFVVNPIAGMGGRVGLKGTDGVIEEARARGAEPRAPDRAVEALEALREHAGDVELLVYGGLMGEAAARDVGFDPQVVGEPEAAATTAADTRDAVRRFAEAGVDLIVFVGGDGTAVDVAAALEAAADIPVLGVPAGVKVYSSVFAVTPRAAGRIAATFEETEEREVADLDEAAYRDGEVRSELRAIVRTPVARDLQGSKQLAGGTVAGLAAAIAEEVEPGVTYILGPGGTVGAIKEALGFDGTALGVDVWRDGAVVVRDAAEADIIAELGDRNVVIVSPIGGQGFVFGRGNDQISPAVLRRSEVMIVASRRKLDDLGVLRVDTGDPSVDKALRGWHRVRVGRFEHRMMEIR